MSRPNITLNQEEIQALLLDDRGEAFKQLLRTSLNKILQAESAEQLRAAPYERSEERTDCRKVIGVFLNEDSVLRLMGSVLIERHDAMLAGRAVFSKDSLSAILKSDIPAKLIVIAEEQRQLRAA